MKVESFVEELQLLAPTKEELTKFNVSEEFTDQFISGYMCIVKSYATYHENADTLLRLLSNYDCSRVEIGVVRFLDTAIEEVEYYKVGFVDIDFLVLNKVTLKIEVRDHDASNHVIWGCASNSDKFLQAMLICAKYLKRALLNPNDELDQSAALNYVNACAETAGGMEYADFYKMALGYFE